jgi:peptidoglycan/xylan/chitin deacetylase (PgdA/CDA1 family)
MSGSWRVVVAAAVWALLIASAPASADTLVVFTVDVESNELRLPDQVDAVCADGSDCGLMVIVRQLRAHGWAGTFFLNVYEHAQWGDATMRKIAVGLQDAGQDVALHTHPHWTHDASRWAMYQYSLDEQTAIVRDGVRLLQTWTGRRVVAHRAGAYAADERTLAALQKNGVLLDSSLLWQESNSRLNALGLARNLPSRFNGVGEIPVSVYEREDRATLWGASMRGATTVRKIDPDWFVDANEARTAIDGLLEANVPVLVVFLHSFSFMTAPPAGGAPIADRHALDMFKVIVDTVAERKLRVVTMRDLAQTFEIVGSGPLPAMGADLVPRVGVQVDAARYLWRLVARSNRVALMSIGAGVLLFMGAVAVFARRRFTHKRLTARELGRVARNGVPAR